MMVRIVMRMLLGVMLVYTGVGHLSFMREAFAAQVPDVLPFSEDFVVVASGVVEIVLGAALVFLGRWQVPIGWVVAAFFVAVFPGNVSQYLNHDPAFGLDTEAKRIGRLFLQPVFVAWALWSTGALRRTRARRTCASADLHKEEKPNTLFAWHRRSLRRH